MQAYYDLTVEKFQSLADFLGVQDREDLDAPVAPAPSNKMTVKAFCKGVLESPQYRESLLRRIVMDDLPPQIEAMMWDRAHGKVIDKLEVKDTSNALEDLTVEQLEERAMYLAEIAKSLRTTEVDSKVH